MDNPLQTSFSFIKNAQDKHSVPALHKNVFACQVYVLVNDNAQTVLLDSFKVFLR